ncbi:MAG: methyltransferase domain-containing protein [Lachnospiraceae bacterium]|nr:methyltransferase domain-containing protein [Lachnospiraceae bacterium]
MQEKDLVIRFYNSIEEEERLEGKHGKIEFDTTMKYIHDFLKPGMRVLEIGAGTGRYSLALAREGYEVDSVELVEHNIEVFQSKLREDDRVNVIQGNAMDLSMFSNEIFDMTLSLGPMYHLFDEKKKRKALEEAIRVTKKGGLIFVAYCMNEATLIQYCFQKGTIWEDMKKGLISEDFHWIANENDAFALMRPEEIMDLTREYSVQRLKLIATDGATRYMDDIVDAMSEEMFELYFKYHLSVCERKDLIGASNHTLDILRRL